MRLVQKNIDWIFSFPNLWTFFVQNYYYVFHKRYDIGVSCDGEKTIYNDKPVGVTEPRSGVQVQINPAKRETINKNDDAVINY